MTSHSLEKESEERLQQETVAAEHVTPYNTHEAKSTQVARMFDNIAPAYDTFNHRLSWNIDRRWRRAAIRQLKPFHPRQILDIATGTGDFAILAARTLAPERLVGIDLSEGMMNVAREKAAREGLADVLTFRRADAVSLPFPDATFDAVTVAFGIRNFEHLSRSLAEMSRVLRSGGHLSVVELSTPPHAPMRQLFALYAHTLMPLVGRLLSKDGPAYRYLTASIEAFPQAEQMVPIMKQAGFSRVKYRRMTQGICTVYLATK